MQFTIQANVYVIYKLSELYKGKVCQNKFYDIAQPPHLKVYFQHCGSASSYVKANFLAQPNMIALQKSTYPRDRNCIIVVKPSQILLHSIFKNMKRLAARVVCGKFPFVCKYFIIIMEIWSRNTFN